MRDPLYHDDKRHDRVPEDASVAAAVARLQWLKLASGLIALVLIVAIWLVWRWSGN
jgi:hypothetical protein